MKNEIEPINLLNETDGYYKLLFGDCKEVLKQIPDCSIDCVITDPPYFIDGMGDNWDLEALNRKTSKSNVVGSLPVGMKFDKKQGLNLQSFMESVSSEIYRVLKPGGFYISFSQGRLYHRMAVAIEDCGFEVRDMLVWYREGQAKAFSLNHFVSKMKKTEEEKNEIITKLRGRKTPQLKTQSEPMILAQKPKDGTFIENWLKYETGLVDVSVSLDGKFPGTVMNVSKPKKDEKTIKHYTVKPTRLISHLIKLFTVEGQVILDPFSGSGSTGVSAIECGRKYIGIELNKEYYELSKERIEEAIEKDNKKLKQI